jgi:hypothetical protein
MEKLNQGAILQKKEGLKNWVGGAHNGSVGRVTGTTPIFLGPHPGGHLSI